jgi:glycosyltransferase involved in cell wall biosynthesis
MKNKINVLFLTVQLETIGGSERLIYDLASSLDRNQFNPSVAWLNGDNILQEFVDLKIPLFHIPKIKRRDFSTFNKIKEIIIANNIHVVNAHHFMPMFYSYYGCKVANHIKLLYTEHSQWEIGRISGKWKLIGKYLLNRLDGVIGVSNAVSDEMQAKFNIAPKRLFSIPNGVNINSFMEIKSRNLTKSSMGFSDSDKIIGIVANLKNNKNHIFLLEAFHEVLNEIDNVKLLIIGEGDENDPDNSENELRSYVQENGMDRAVYFLGYRSDIPEILSILDIFCLTSVKEGLPISLIEAMATGIPVIGSDVEGIRDVIIPNVNGFLVRLGDVLGLKDAFLTLLKDDILCHEFGRKSQALTIKSYSIKQCVNQYQALFKPVA